MIILTRHTERFQPQSQELESLLLKIMVVVLNHRPILRKKCKDKVLKKQKGKSKEANRYEFHTPMNTISHPWEKNGPWGPKSFQNHRMFISLHYHPDKGGQYELVVLRESKLLF